jgi:hypothetical protein
MTRILRESDDANLAFRDLILAGRRRRIWPPTRCWQSPATAALIVRSAVFARQALIGKDTRAVEFANCELFPLQPTALERPRVNDPGRWGRYLPARMPGGSRQRVAHARFKGGGCPGTASGGLDASAAFSGVTGGSAGNGAQEAGEPSARKTCPAALYDAPGAPAT